jgi:hypothetical protein
MCCNLSQSGKERLVCCAGPILLVLEKLKFVYSEELRSYVFSNEIKTPVDKSLQSWDG